MTADGTFEAGPDVAVTTAARRKAGHRAVEGRSGRYREALSSLVTERDSSEGGV